jgi:hypothetical protein
MKAAWPNNPGGGMAKGGAIAARLLSRKRHING